MTKRLDNAVVDGDALVTGDLKVLGTVTGTVASTNLSSGAAAADTVAQADGAGAVTFVARLKSICKTGSTALTGAVTVTGGRDITVTQAAQVLTIDADVLAIRTAAGVPAGAPVEGELPLAYDTTAVSGGAYFWTGAAWVKIATIL